jgi:DNA-binding PadR family transcriptional regulator
MLAAARIEDPSARPRYGGAGKEAEETVRDFTRGAVRVHILHHAAEREINGAWMSAELAHHGYKISPGTLYPMLHRMEAEGLLTSEQRVLDGRAIRLYRATEAGHATLAEDRIALAELAREVLPGFTSRTAPPNGDTATAG